MEFLGAILGIIVGVFFVQSCNETEARLSKAQNVRCAQLFKQCADVRPAITLACEVAIERRGCWKKETAAQGSEGEGGTK